MAAETQQPAPAAYETSKEGVVKTTTKEEQAPPAFPWRGHDLKYVLDKELAEEAKEDTAAITVDEEATKEGIKTALVQQSAASFKEEMNVPADLIDPYNKEGLQQRIHKEQASRNRGGKFTTTLHMLLPPSHDLRQGMWIIDSGNDATWRADPAAAGNRCVPLVIAAFVAAVAGLTVLIVSNHLALGAAHPTTMLLLFLLIALVTLLVFRQMRSFDHLFQVDRIPHRAEESFRLAWRSLVLVQCAVFFYIILPVPISATSTPTSTTFTSVATAASAIGAVAAVAVAAALPLLYLLFPLLLVLLLWFVVCGPERLHKDQGLSLITWRSLFQALCVILSCSLLLTNPTAAGATVGMDIAAVAIVAVLTITSFWFALSSNPPVAQEEEAAPQDLLADQV